MPQPSGQIARTSRGVIEYALCGEGPTVILCHGTGGGYDRGLVLSRLLHGLQGIAVSRAGYLHTPLETGSAPAELADAYAALLDWLHIEKAAILRGGGHECLVSHWREITPRLNAFLKRQLGLFESQQ